jgi:acyl-CoA thioester hydrolase
MPCRVEWVDTDASGHYHHGTLIRWVESAEAEMFRRIGRPDLYGSIPRVHYEADYHARVWFGDEVELRLTIDRVGRSSLAMSFSALSGETIVATGKLVQVNAGADGHADPWADDVRAALEALVPGAGSSAPSTNGVPEVRTPLT